MKKIIIVLISILMAFMLTSCALFNGADTNTVYVKKNGTVIGTMVETFDKDYYDKEELKEFINNEIDDYKQTTGEDTVKIKSFKVKDQSAKIEIEYDSVTDYKAFNQIDFFAGTIGEALTEGYSFDEEFLEVVDGNIGEVVNTTEIKEDEKLNVIITEEIGDVRTAGDVLFVGSIHAEIKAKKLVSITEVDESDENMTDEKMLTYIIYK